MHIFLAGATGAVGQALVPLLISNGHTVTGTTRTPAKVERLRAQGVEPVVLDGLDGDAVRAAVAAAKPDAIVHQMTALSGDLDLRRFERSFAATNRLRTEGTQQPAVRRVGVRRRARRRPELRGLARGAGRRAGQDGGRSARPASAQAGALHARGDPGPRDRWSREAGGIALRYGGFYGPGTASRPAASSGRAVRARKFPIVGDGGGVWSFCHIDDVAGGTLAALEHGAPGRVYNICDDEPAPVREWLPAVAESIGAPPPRHLPRWVGRLMGEHLVTMMCEIRGASNARAKRELGWAPAWPSWREGIPALAAPRKEALR